MARPSYPESLLDCEVWDSKIEQQVMALPEQQKQDMKQSQDQDETQRSAPLPLKLSPFFDSGSLSDITSMVGSSIFHTHKLILSSWSPVFKEMLLERSKSDEPHVLEEAQEYEAVFSDFLKFMYTETIEISKDTVYSLYKLSKKYEVKEICDLCEEFLIGEVSDDIIALQTLTYAEEFGITKVYDHCFKFLETNFFRLSDLCFKKMSPSLFLKLLESSDLVVQSERHLFNRAVRWLYKDGNEYHEYTKDVISKIHFAHMSSLDLIIFKNGLHIRTHMYDGSLGIHDKIQKSLDDSGLQDSIHDAFEWKALASCKEEEFRLYPLFPRDIKTFLSKKHCVDHHIYIPEFWKGYQDLILSDNFQNKLYISVTGVFANNDLSEESSKWSVTGSKFYDKKSKNWEIRYRLEPHEMHQDCTYRLAILTNAGSPYMNPIVTTSKGVVTRTKVKVEQVLHDSEAIKELKSVKIKVVIMVKIIKFNPLRGQLQMLEESLEELRLRRLIQQSSDYWPGSDIDCLDSSDDNLW